MCESVSFVGNGELVAFGDGFKSLACFFCTLNKEDNNHIFLTCLFAKANWLVMF